MTTSNASNQRADSRNPFARFYDFAVSPRGFFTILIVYTIAHILLRLWISPNLGIDDVEQAMFARDWRLGYNPRQPPLYTWLLFGGISVLGQSLLTHLIVKYSALAAMYAASYGAARQLLQSPQSAALATYALVLLYNVAYGAHVGYTHSLLLSVFIFATLWTLARAFESGRLRDYVLLGIALGLGFLTKFGFALFVAPLLVGCCFAAPLRRGLFNWRTLIALAIAALILAAPVYWMLHVRYSYENTLRQVAHVAAHQDYLANVGAGLLSLVAGTPTFLAPFWLVALLFWPSLRKPRDPARPWLKAMALALALTLAMLVAFVLIAQVTDFKPRYMHPILLTAPLLFFLWLDHRPTDQSRERWFAGLVAAFVLIVFGGLAGQAILEPAQCRNCWLQMPLPALARDIEAQGLAGGTIVTADARIGGNLGLYLRNSRILTPDFPMADASATGRGQCLLVWNSRILGEAPPGPLANFLTEHFGGGAPAGPIRYVAAPLLRGGARTDSFGVMRVSGRDGDCSPN